MWFIFFLFIVCFIAFIIYRYKKYQAQREIEESAANAQAYVSAETLELLQRYKKLASEHHIPPQESAEIEKKIKFLTHELICYGGTHQLVREYVNQADQELVLLRNKLDKLENLSVNPQIQKSNDAFDALLNE